MISSISGIPGNEAVPSETTGFADPKIDTLYTGYIYLALTVY